MTRFRVLIVSYAYWEGLSRLPALLHKAGCEVSVLGVPRNFPSRSIYVKRSYSSPNDVHAVVADLKVHVESQPGRYDWIIIGDDPLLYALAERLDESWAQQCFPCRDQDSAMVVSKARFLAACSSAGILIPEYRICENADDLQAAADALGYPLVLKETQGFAGLAVRIVQNREQLQAIEPSQALIAQRFIQGSLASAAALFRHGKPLAWFSYYRERTWGPLGPSAAVRFQVFPELAGMLQKLGQLSGFHGLCGIDFIQEHGSGRLYLLEQNFRPTLTVHLGQRIGVDFRKTIPAMMDIEALSHLQPQSQNPDLHQVVALFPQDAMRAIDEGHPADLFKWLVYPNRWPELRINEPRIFIKNLSSLARKLKRARSGG